MKFDLFYSLEIFEEICFLAIVYEQNYLGGHYHLQIITTNRISWGIVLKIKETIES